MPDPRLDHIEDQLIAKLPGYERYAPAPQPLAPPTGVTVKTSPGAAELSWEGVPDATGYAAMYTGPAGPPSPVVTTTALGVEFADLELGSHTFAVQSTRDAAASDWAKVTGTVPGVTPTPTPPPSTPWPMPPKPGEKWVPRTIPDAPAYPPDPSDVATGDLSKLTKPAKLPPGDYFTTGDITVDLVGTRDSLGRPSLCTLKLKDSQQIVVQNISGITVTSGGTHGDDMEKNGSVFLASGKRAHSCRFTGSAGLGLLFVPGGKGTSVWYCEIDNCDCGHMGMSKCVDAVVRGNYFHDCNKAGRRNTNKPVRCEGQYIADNVYDRGRAPHLWQDQYNNRTKRGTIARNYFGSATTDDKDQPWSIAGLRTEINGPAGIDVTDNYFVTFYSCDETRNVIVKGNTFEGRTYPKAIELRNKRRGSPEMWLENIQISGNRFNDNRAEIGPSNDSPPTLSGNKIVVAADNVWPDGKVGPHVKIPN